MDLPLIGRVDLTPSGLFLVFAVLVAVGYLAWQIMNSRRAARITASAEDPGPAGSHVESPLDHE